MSFNIILKSVVGHRLGLSASGGLLFKPTTSTGVSHAAELSSAGKFNSSIDGASAIGQWGSSLTGYKGFIEKVSATNVKMVNYGLSHVTSDVINGATLLIAAPEAGIHKEIYFDSSASTMSIGTTAAGISFGASVESSVHNVEAAGGVMGTSLTMRGLSATKWALLGRRKLGDHLT